MPDESMRSGSIQHSSSLSVSLSQSDRRRIFSRLRVDEDHVSTRNTTIYIHAQTWSHPKRLWINRRDGTR